MTLKLSQGAALRITKAQLEGRKSVPTSMADSAAISAAVGAAVHEVLAAVAAELAEHLAIIEDLQDRLAQLEEKP